MIGGLYIKMKKIILCMILISMLSMTGCWRYGEGEAIGYVNAVDDGILWDTVWLKTSMDTSQEDCYIIDNDNVKRMLKGLVGKEKVKLIYDRHFFTLSTGCGEDGGSDEITNFEIIP